MTGRAGTAKGVAFGLYILIGEGVRGRGGHPIDPESGVGGFFYWGHVSVFFCFFFKCFFNIVFISFLFNFGWVLEANLASKIGFWAAFWDVFLVPSFWSIFCSMLDVFFDARILKNRAPV